MDKKKNEVILLDGNTILQQAMLYKMVFGIKREDDDCISFWTKKHYQNPLGKSLIFGVFIDGELAGMNAYLPTYYQVNGKKVLSLQSCESCVNPKYQGRGIWSSIVHYAVDYVFTKTEYQVIMGFPNYRNSYPGFKKMKWEVLSNMDNLILVNNSKSFVRTILGKNSIAEFCSFPLNLQKTARVFHKKYDVVECSSSELVWIYNENSICLLPQEDWLKWKFNYKDLKSVVIKSGEKAIATCIYSIDLYKNEQVIKIEKLSICPDSRSKANDIISSVSRYLGNKYPLSAFIRVWVQSGDAVEVNFKQMLFLKSSHPNPFIIKQPGNELTGFKWQLSFFDLD